MIREFAIVVTKESSLLKPFGMSLKVRTKKLRLYKDNQSKQIKKPFPHIVRKRMQKCRVYKGFPPNDFNLLNN